MTVWCKSGRVPIHTGTYHLAGQTITVRRSQSGRYYACRGERYVPGLIWQLRAHLEAHGV